MPQDFSLASKTDTSTQSAHGTIHCGWVYSLWQNRVSGSLERSGPMRHRCLILCNSSVLPRLLQGNRLAFGRHARLSLPMVDATLRHLLRRQRQELDQSGDSQVRQREEDYQAVTQPRVIASRSQSQGLPPDEDKLHYLLPRLSSEAGDG